MRIAASITLTSEQRSKLEAYERGRSVARRLVERARIVLFAAEGKQNDEIAELLDIGRHTVARWRERFLDLGVAGLEKDAPRAGRTRTVDAQEIVRKTTQEKPPNATHWSTRSMARAVGVSEASIRRVWQPHGLKPHRLEAFKISRDPQLPRNCRTSSAYTSIRPNTPSCSPWMRRVRSRPWIEPQPSLPLKKGRGATMTHDYKRYGTTTLFAALNGLDGKVLSQCRERHTHEDWIAFLRLIDRETPPENDVHVIADNYSAHKHPKVQCWLKRHTGAFICISHLPVLPG